MEEWIGEGDVTPEGGEVAMLHILSKVKTLPTAFFATNDAMAMGALQVFRKYGIEIPEQISLIGFDDIEAASHMNPPLTSVSVEKEEMGRVGIQLLMNRMQKPKSPFQRVVLPTRLVIRKSVQKSPEL